jgi:hypothetical protein
MEDMARGQQNGEKAKDGVEQYMKQLVRHPGQRERAGIQRGKSGKTRKRRVL